MDHDLNDFLQTAVDTATKAGDIVTEAYMKEKLIETKSCVADLVTETDQRVEKFIKDSLLKAYPSHKFIGEESIVEGKKCDWTDAPTWIVDPIDGTCNFVHRIPFTCVCIGLSVDKEVKVGVVYAPVAKQMFTAVKGQGAFLNGERISVSKISVLQNAVVYCEGGSSRNEDQLAIKMENARKVVMASHGIRALGSAAYNMCMVAMGAGDAYIEYGIHIWDIAASGVIVTEAGGVLLNCEAKPVDLLKRQVLCASTRTLAEQLSTTVTHIDDLESD